MNFVGRMNGSFFSSAKGSKAAALVVIVILAATAGLRILHDRDHVLEGEIANLTQVSVAAEVRVAESFRSIQRLLEVIGQKAPDSSGIGNLIRPFADVRHAFVVDARGTVTHSTLPDLIGQDVSARPYISELRRQPADRKFWMTPTIRTMDGREDAVFVSMRLDQADGNWGGATVVALDIDFFVGVARGMLVPGTGNSAALISVTGDIVARYPDPAAYIGKSVTGGQAFAGHIASGQSQTVHRVMAATDGTDKLIVARTFQAAGMSPLLLFVTRSVDEVLSPWRRDAAFEGVMLLLSCAGVGFLGWLGARREGMLRQAGNLIEENIQLVQALQQSPASVVITDLDGQIQYVNPAFTRVTGYEPDEVMGQNPRLLKTGHTKDDEYREMWFALKSGEPWSTVFLNKRKDGTTYWEQAQISPLRDSLGTMTGYIAVKENISERMAAEQTIRDLNRRLQSILDAASEVAIIATDPNGVITIFNRGAELMLGYTAEEMVGHVSPLVFHDPGEVAARSTETAKDFRVFVHRALEDGHDIGEWTYVRKDGQRLPVSLMVTPVRDDGGEIAGYLGIAIDIGPERRARAELIESNRQLDRQARELERVNNELAEFAYAASHDLRQPLRMVSSYLTLIERRLGDKLDPEGRTYFGFAVDGAKRMDALILGLLDYSRIGRGGAEFERVSLQRVVETQVRTLVFALEEARGRVEVAPDLPDVMGDEQELNRLLGNLLGNAVKYRAPNRPLRVEVGWNVALGEIILWVKDNGRGMDPKDHERAFRVFQRLVSQTEIEGTGIGLAICRKIAQHHGGRMWITSANGEGCTFHVAFPAVEAP